MWERLSIAIFFGVANGNVDNFYVNMAMAPGSDQWHLDLFSKGGQARQPQLLLLLLLLRTMIFVPFEKASEMRDSMMIYI